VVQIGTSVRMVRSWVAVPLYWLEGEDRDERSGEAGKLALAR
jgi:hypothetical protein